MTTLPQHNSPKKFFWVGFLFIALINLAIYYHSLYHMPRSDQINYIADFVQEDDWYSLAVESYAFNRTRTYEPGDTILFRPVLLFLLGTERYFLGNRFMVWQAVGILLHLIVVWLLLKLLLEIKPSGSAYVLTAFFSCLLVNFEMVSWHHIHSYLVFIILTLISLIQCLKYVRDEEKQTSRVFIITFCMFINCFLYEISNVYLVLFFFFLWFSCSEKKERRAPLWVMFVPCILYVTLSVLDFQARNITDPEIAKISSFSPLDTIQQLGILLAWWTYAGLFPKQLNLQFADRSSILSPQETIPHFMNTLDYAGYAGIALCVVFLIIFAQSLTRSLFKERGHLINMLFLMIMAYGLLIIIGRAQVRGFEYLQSSVYYIYTFWLLLIIFVFSLINHERIRQIRFNIFTKSLAVLLLLGLSYVNGHEVFKSNKVYAQMHQPTRTLINEIETLIQERGDEFNFSFYVDPEFPGNQELFFLINFERDAPYSLVEILYPRRYSHLSATYDAEMTEFGAQFVKIRSVIDRNQKLIGHWKLHHNKDYFIKDLSGLDHHGEVVVNDYSSPTSNNDYLYFKNENQFVIIPDTDALDLQNNFTLMARFKLKDLKGAQTVLSKHSMKNDEDIVNFFLKKFDTDDNFVLQLDGLSGGTDDFIYFNHTPAQTDQWIHLTATYDGKYVKFYFNGQLDGTTAARGLVKTNTADLIMGSSLARNDQGLHGQIDYVKIYSSALTKAEVRQEYLLSLKR